MASRLQRCFRAPHSTRFDADGAPMMHPSEAWRLLELPSAPTVEQVKAAYRRLAKSLHPDLSREHRRAVEPARFARLTVAYETALAEATAANRRGVGAPTSGQPSQRHTRRPPKRRHAVDDATSDRLRATPGSTTYPDALYEGDPEWDGAGWVGASSGTYWTVNPKEYADPRRHGPEYRARGRRPVHRPRASERREVAEERGESEGYEDRRRRGLIARIAARLAVLLRRQGRIEG